MAARHGAMRVVLASLCVALAGCASRPPSQNLQVGGARIAYVQAGSAQPVAVLQAGLGDGKAVWAGLIERVSPHLAVFAYDRPGYGGSSAVPGWPAAPPRDACAVAHELHAVLQAGGQRPPYLLVGHSIGGLYQYAFARLYPAEVVAVLLVDPTHPDHWARLQRDAPASAALLKGLRATVFSEAMRAEFDAQASPGCAAELATRPAPTMPARLLVRADFSLAEKGAFEPVVRSLEAQWPQLLPRLTRRQVDGAGHYIQQDRPDVVADELTALWRQVRPDTQGQKAR